MAVNGNALSALIQQKMDSKFKQVMSYGGPLAQDNPSYFIQMCSAIGNGIVNGSPVISFNTVDSGSAAAPAIPGIGVGVGIVVDQAWFAEKIYTSIRSKIIAKYGKTAHPSWPPSEPNFLKATSEAISEGVAEHYLTARTLNSTHPIVYQGVGVINKGGFSGVSASAVASAIQGLGSSLSGSAWQDICLGVGEAYAEAIMLNSTGQVVITGICIPSESQACGISGSGVGSGTAS